MQEGALTLEGVCDPSLICMLLDSLGYLVDFAVLQVEDPYFHYAKLLHKFDQLVYKLFAIYLDCLYPSGA